MIKVKKIKALRPAKSSGLLVETKRAHVRLEEVRSGKGSAERSMWVRASALVLRDLTKKAEASGVSLGGVLAGRVRRIVKAPATTISPRTSAHKTGKRTP